MCLDRTSCRLTSCYTAGFEVNASQLLASFLSNALAKRRDRYAEFAVRPKTQPKLLRAFHHERLECFDQRKVVESLPESAWALPAFTFSSPSTFGLASSSLRAAYEAESDAFLIITANGRYGVHREEDLVDTELLIDLGLATTV